MTNAEYENHYKLSFDNEYERIIKDFSSKWDNNKHNHSAEKKISDFWDYLLATRNNLYTERPEPDRPIEDRYYTDLVKEFMATRRDYEKDKFFLKFIEIEVPKIKQIIVKHNFPVVKPNIFKASNKDTIGHIAIYYATMKLIADYPNDQYAYQMSKDEFIETWRTDIDLRIKQRQDLGKVDKKTGKVGRKAVSIFWTGGKNKTQFAQLIYALHEAKLLNNGEGEITKIVEELGTFLKVDLPDSWMQNFSSGNIRVNSDHFPAIFENLTKAYKRYLSNRIEEDDPKK